MSAAAVLDDLSLRFGNRWALVRLSLEVPAGKTLLLTGSNGAGKTTLLRVIATALRPTRGKLHLFGWPAAPNPDPVRSRVALVTHQSHLYEDMSAVENLRLVARLTGRDPRRAEPLLERVGLAKDADRTVRFFSAGMKRRLCIARLLLREPELALLDEPFGQLDPGGVTLVEGILRELRAAGTTVILSTHDLDRGERVADLHLALAGGRMVAPIAEVGT